uniref:Uncharacterized protein n=1 Tax=Oryza barthii TaxID=65489 RepID=A0A0D3F0R7_9ORYZ
MSPAVLIAHGLVCLYSCTPCQIRAVGDLNTRLQSHMVQANEWMKTPTNDKYVSEFPLSLKILS